MKTNILLTILVLLGVASCVSKNQEDHDSDISKDRDIVLIFDENQDNNRYAAPPHFPKNCVFYYKDGIFKKKLALNNEDSRDTIVVQVSGGLERMPVHLQHNRVIFDYHLKPGDTVRFTFQENVPYADIINREAKPSDANFSLGEKSFFLETLKREQIPVASFSSQKLSPEQLVEDGLERYRSREKYLDSLENNGLLSSDIRQLVSIRNQINIAPFFMDDRYKQHIAAFAPLVNLDEIMANELLLYHDFFHRFLYWQYLQSDELAVPKVRHAQGISLDYKTAYDTVKDKLPEGKVRNYLMFHCLLRMEEEDTKDNFQAYLEQFRQDVLTSDSVYTAYLDHNYDADLLASTGESVLVDIAKKQRVEFDDMLAGLKGKLVYVDLWASWCVPCRVAMESSRELKAELKDEDVVFVYVSIDSKFADWEKASHEEGLQDEKHSFLLLDAKQAELTRNIGLTSIPRYLLYNRDGEMFHKNAPGPDSPELLKILNQF